MTPSTKIKPKLGALSGGTEELIYPFVEDGTLSITENGEVWRIRARCHGSKVSMPRRAERLQKDGYLKVYVKINGKSINVQASRLVYRHFSGKPIPEGLTVNHESGDKTDNRPENLTLMTASEQLFHRIYYLQQESTLVGENNPRVKLTEKQVLEIRARRKSGESLTSIAVDYGIAFQVVSRISKRELWKHLP